MPSLAGCLDVGHHLRLERVDALEFPLRADPLEEFQPERLLVEITGEVEQEGLDPVLILAEGRAVADVHDARARYTPAASTSGRSGLRLAVGKPSVRPRPAPRRTVPLMAYGWPKSSAARTASPVPRSWRIAPEDTVWPWRRSGGSTRAVKPHRGPSSVSSAAVPRASWPNVWLNPTITSLAPSVPTTTSCTNASASIRENSSVNGMISAASAPSPRMRSRLSSRVAMGSGARSGHRTLAGCGSKVQTTDGRPSARPRSMAVVIRSACPRWMPSKAPSAVTHGERSGG